MVCGVLAAVNLLLSRTVYRQIQLESASVSGILSRYQRRKRPPLWMILIIPLVMAATATLVALVSGTVVGFALAAVYAAAGFSMST